jgi:hypothetical protein
VKKKTLLGNYSQQEIREGAGIGASTMLTPWYSLLC